VNFRYRRLSTAVNTKWTDVTPYSGTVGRFRKQRAMVDINASLRLWRGTLFRHAELNDLTLFVQARNIFDVPDYIYDSPDQQRINKVEYYGAIWTFGVKGSF